MRDKAIMSPDAPIYEAKGMALAVQFFTADCRLRMSKDLVQICGRQYKRRADETKDVLYHAMGTGFRRMAYIIAMRRS